MGTTSWKVINLVGRSYDAIMGQNFLVPFKAKINLEEKYIEINNNKIIFEDSAYPFIISEIYTLEGISDNFQKKLKLEHLNYEESNSIVKLLKQNEDLFLV